MFDIVSYALYANIYMFDGLRLSAIRLAIATVAFRGPRSSGGNEELIIEGSSTPLTVIYSHLPGEVLKHGRSAVIKGLEKGGEMVTQRIIPAVRAQRGNLVKAMLRDLRRPFA
jgi:hypothetical protein